MAGGVDPATVKEFSIITAPPAHYWLSMIVQPALAAATYTLLAAWNGSPTLDRPGRTGCPGAGRTLADGAAPAQWSR